MSNTLQVIAGAIAQHLMQNPASNVLEEYNLGTLKVRAKSYRQSAKLLRQINSDKMEVCRLYKNLLDWGTFISTMILTFSGFYGLEKLSTQVFFSAVSKDVLEPIFNGLILSVLIMTALQIAGRFGEKQVEHFGTVQILTDFITDLDDILLVQEMNSQYSKKKLKDLNQIYKGITSSLPENSDKEWLKAKKKLQIKKLSSRELRAQHFIAVIRRARRKRVNAKR